MSLEAPTDNSPSNPFSTYFEVAVHGRAYDIFVTYSSHNAQIPR